MLCIDINPSQIDIEEIDRKRQQYGLYELTEAEQTLSLITWTEYEIVLGGLRGFYHNSEGNFAEQAVDAFERVGASDTARALRKANAAFPNEAPVADRQLRSHQLEMMDGPYSTLLDDLTDECHTATDNLGLLLEQYIVAHAQDLPFKREENDAL